MSTRTLTTAAVTVSLGFLGCALAACGNDSAPSSESTTSPSSTTSAEQKIGGCAPDDQAVTGAKSLTTATVGGDSVQVKLATKAPCANVLFAVVDGTPSQVTVDQAPTSAAAISVPGRDDDLVATTTSHPRGGDQVRLYAFKDASMVELTRAGQPLIPFRATDTQSPAAAADCAGNGRIRVLQARPTKPMGVAMTYDIFAVTYDVSGSSAEQVGGERKVAHTIPDRQMKAKYPAMFSGKQFGSCSG